MEDKQVHPIPDVFGIWEHDWSVYPDVIRVPMRDGHVVDYFKPVEQPAPILGIWLDHFAKTCQVGGYKYKEKGRGKRLGRIKYKDEERKD